MQTPSPEAIPTQPQIGQQVPYRSSSPNAGCGKAAGIGCGVVVILFVIFVALGAILNMKGSSGQQFSSLVRSSQPHHAAQPPKARVLLDVEGNGIKTTQRFEAPDEWAIAWTYDCSNFGYHGNFSINVQGDVDDIAANQMGANGHDVTYEHSGGNVYLSINSECAWHIRAISQ